MENTKRREDWRGMRRDKTREEEDAGRWEVKVVWRRLDGGWGKHKKDILTHRFAFLKKCQHLSNRVCDICNCTVTKVQAKVDVFAPLILASDFTLHEHQRTQGSTDRLSSLLVSAVTSDWLEGGVCMFVVTAAKHSH